MRWLWRVVTLGWSRAKWVQDYEQEESRRQMRDYGRVHTAFWSSPTIAPLSDDGKLLSLYLMTCPHNTIAGIFRLPDGYITEDMKWGPERVTKGFAELFDNGFAHRCPETKWVWICKHLEWNPPENPNQRKAVEKVIATVPKSCSWLDAFNGSRRVTETVSEPRNNIPVPVPVVVPVEGGEGGSQEQDLPAGFMAFWKAWPKSERKTDRVKCLKAWRRDKLEGRFEEIVAHVQTAAATKQWQDGYEPAPLTYLNGRRYEDPVEGPGRRASNGVSL